MRCLEGAAGARQALEQGLMGRHMASKGQGLHEAGSGGHRGLWGFLSMGKKRDRKDSVGGEKLSDTLSRTSLGTGLKTAEAARGTCGR